MKIRVKSAEVATRSVKRKTDGREFKFREQDAFAAMGDEVRRFTLSLSDDQPAYPPGEYEVIFDQSVEVDRNGRLALKRLAIRPLVAVASKAG